MRIIVVIEIKTLKVDLFSVKTLAAKFIGVNSRTISRAIESGRIVKGRWKFTEQEVTKMKGRGTF